MNNILIYNQFNDMNPPDHDFTYWEEFTLRVYIFWT